MKILVYKSGYVDLDSPVHMTETQRKKFIEFFRSMFPGNVEVYDIKEKTKNYHSREIIQKKWTIEEYELLLGPDSNLELSEKLGRTEMSVKMQRGSFVPEFFAWLKKKGYSQSSINKKLIEKYLEEKEGEA